MTERKSRSNWIVRRLKQIKCVPALHQPYSHGSLALLMILTLFSVILQFNSVPRLAGTVIRYGALPATLFYVYNYTEPEPDLLSLFNPLF